MDPAAEAAIAGLQAQLQAFQTEILTLQNAAAVAAAGAAPALGVPMLPVFTLAPALANTAAFLDLTSASGTKHFKGATEPLSLQLFNFEDPADLQVFLDILLKKSQVWGWNTVFTIPVADATTGLTTNYNLVDQYGMIPLASVNAEALTYYTTHTKRAQDSFMICQCLLASLSIDFLKLITADSGDYHLPAIVATEGAVPSGPLLLKLIISKAHVDSRATVSFIRTSLTLLDDKMIEVDSNIETFNFYVKAQVKSLSARGETSSDLLTNLFKGYKAANDVEFADFIRRKQNLYEEGGDVTHSNLMADSLAKYKARMLVGQWTAPTKEQGQILALTARVEMLTKSAKRGPSTTKPPGKDNDKSKSNKKKGDSKWAWKDVLPKDGEPKTKDFQGKHYHVGCKYHPNQWVCHETAECSKNPANQRDGASDAEAARLEGAKLAAAAIEDDDPDEEGDF
jgi:hypothetical protein